MILEPINRATTLLSRMRWNVDLVGDKDGVNLEFTAPDLFLNVSPTIVRVYWNGQRLREGASEDFEASESGGAGAGFDTITLTGPPPAAGDTLTADYVLK